MLLELILGTPDQALSWNNNNRNADTVFVNYVKDGFPVEMSSQKIKHPQVTQISVWSTAQS